MQSIDYAGDSLVWHRFHYVDIPTLPVLREQLMALERGQSERPSMLFLLTLLYDLALDVPSTQLAPCRKLQPAVRAFLSHSGQEFLFSLSSSRYTILGLVLAAQYRPLAFTSSQHAATLALHALPYTILAKQIATEQGYSTAGTRLTHALHASGDDVHDLLPLMYECLHWIRLTMAGTSLDSIFASQSLEDSMFQCLEALDTASLLGQMPAEMLLPYTTMSSSLHMMASFRNLSKNWRDLEHLGQIISSHKAICDEQKEGLERSLAASGCHRDKLNAISHLGEGERHLVSRTDWYEGPLMCLSRSRA